MNLRRGTLPDVFPMDPWFEPYIYEYPRKDGHKGFLLFSKGPDGQASVFEQELTATPKKKILMKIIFHLPNQVNGN